MDFIYKFPVVRGIQGEREYYIAMIPLKMIPRLFPSDEEEYLPPEYRAQRKLNESRIPVISRYILNNRNSYVFSALAASIDGEFKFIPVVQKSDLGTLEVSMDARFLINDGQHRKAAIFSALKEDNTLADETISIVFYSDMGLRRSQQIFTDLNKNAVKTSNSISELYDSRDEVAVATRDAVNAIEFLNTYTDKEKDNLGKFSSNLFTLNMFYSANKTIFSKRNVGREGHQFLVKFWNAIVDNMAQWQEVSHKEITKVDLRENYIASQGIVIQAFGRIGNYLIANREYEPEKCLKGIAKVNWRRANSQWHMRCINENGRIIANKRAAKLIANVIKKETGIPFTDDEKKIEQEYLKTYVK
jgi:DNA sulfur modification protein DndB